MSMYIVHLWVLTRFFRRVNSYGFDIKKEYKDVGMIDWLTLRLDLRFLPRDVIEKLRSKTSTICKISPDGDIDWKSYCWESVRSDTHQVSVRVGGYLYVQGSPARIGLQNNVFGSLDITYCANKMILFAAEHLGIDSIPSLEHWTCSRIDVTRNYQMSSGSEARQALEYIKQTPESRQKHYSESNGFYIGKRSTLHKGKIYLKGQDAKRNKQMRRAQYTENQILKAEKLLRAEYTLARHGLNRLLEENNCKWFELDKEILLRKHTEFFEEYFSDIEVSDMSNILEKLIEVAPTRGRAQSAYDCYTRIKMFGYDQAKISYSDSTWRNHTSYLKKAGFKRADLQMINVTPLRKRQILLDDAVRCWDDIKLVKEAA